MAKKSFSALVKSETVLIDFYADWCGPCKTLSPIVQQVASEMHHRLKVIKVNIDKNQHAAMKYGIRAVPTLVLFKNGQIVWRQSGALPKHELLKKLNQLV